MKHDKPMVYGIGNPLIDIIVQVSDEDLSQLGIHKGTMHLIDAQRRSNLLNYLSNKEFSYSCGGSCPNTIITLASLGVATTLAGMVGNDEFGTIYQKRLTELAVRDELTFCDQPTGSSIILISPDSERTMNTYLGANRQYSRECVVGQTVRAADFFHFTGYMWDTQPQKAAVTYALEIAKSSGTRVSFDIADPFAVARNRDTFLQLIKHHADIVFANSEEARILFDNYDAYECCKSMGKLCETAIVKNGKHGSFISYRQKIMKIPVQGPVVPTDTTGAGDVYAAGLLYGLCHQLTIEESGFIASLLAGEIIQQRGAQFPLEKSKTLQQELERRYR